MHDRNPRDREYHAAQENDRHRFVQMFHLIRGESSWPGGLKLDVSLTCWHSGS